MFDRSKLESLRDVSVTRIGDTLSYGFPEIVYIVKSLWLWFIENLPNYTYVAGEQQSWWSEGKNFQESIVVKVFHC